MNGAWQLGGGSNSVAAVARGSAEWSRTVSARRLGDQA
jgi:hypothetical protein